MRARLATSGLAAIIVFGVACAPASAGLMSGLFYTADPGEINHVTAGFDGSAITFHDSAGVRVEDPGYSGDKCTQVDATSFRCPGLHMGGNGIFLELGDGDDSFSYVGPAPPDPEAHVGSCGFPRGCEANAFNVSGGDGNDTLSGSPYQDHLEGSGGQGQQARGDDHLSGGLGWDHLSDSDGGHDTFDGGAGNDLIDPRSDSLGVNTIIGGPGDDYIDGGAGPDAIDGGAGKDHVFGGYGADVVRGGAGNDGVEGGPGKDISDGGPGNDFVQASFHGGCGGPDTLIGGSGRDEIYVYCGVPTIKLRDKEKDTGSCTKRVKPKRVSVDRIDRLKGGCATKKR